MLPDPDQSTVLESVWSTIMLEVVHPSNMPSTVYTVVDVLDQSENIMRYTRIFTRIFTELLTMYWQTSDHIKNNLSSICCEVLHVQYF